MIQVKCYHLEDGKLFQLLDCPVGHSPPLSNYHIQLRFQNTWIRRISWWMVYGNLSYSETSFIWNAKTSHLLSPLLIYTLLPPSIFPSITVFSNESVLYIRWPEYWSFTFSISSSNDIHDRFPLRLTGFISLQSKELSGVFSNTTVQKHQFFSAQLSL